MLLEHVCNPSDPEVAVKRFSELTGDGLADRFRDAFEFALANTPASAWDVGEAAADLFTKFGITSADEMRQALATLDVFPKVPHAR